MKVKHLLTSSNKPATNQFLLFDDKNSIQIFQSYDTVIAKREKGKVSLDSRFWKYSQTTNRYRNQFLGETKKETEQKIKTGEYQLVDLNS